VVGHGQRLTTEAEITNQPPMHLFRVFGVFSNPAVKTLPKPVAWCGHEGIILMIDR